MARMVICGPCNHNKRKALSQSVDNKGCVDNHPHTDLALLAMAQPGDGLKGRGRHPSHDEESRHVNWMLLGKKCQTWTQSEFQRPAVWWEKSPKQRLTNH